MILTRPITIDVDDAHPERCPEGCPLWNNDGMREFCNTELLKVTHSGYALRAPECLRDAKEKP